MKYRRLRIAFSVVCGIVCVLLVALWVRSYSCVYVLKGGIGRDSFYFQSQHGQIGFFNYTGPRSGFISYPLPVDVPVQGFQTVSGWDYSWTSNRQWYLVIRLWVPAIVLAALGTAPWLLRRYSLRTLLIAMTLAALSLGYIVYAHNAKSEGILA